MRLVDRGLEALIAPTPTASPLSVLAVLGAAAAGLAVLGMAAKDNPFFGLLVTNAHDEIQPNALTLRAFREARNVSPGSGWGLPYQDWSPEEKDVFMDWAHDNGLADTMQDIGVSCLGLSSWERYDVGSHLRCKELNAPIIEDYSEALDPRRERPIQALGYLTQWGLEGGAHLHVRGPASGGLCDRSLDDEEVLEAVLDACELKLKPKSLRTCVIGAADTRRHRALEVVLVTDAPLEPLNTESTSSMLERSKRRFWQTSDVNFLVEDVERR